MEKVHPNQILFSHFLEALIEGNRAKPFFRKYQYLVHMMGLIDVEIWVVHLKGVLFF